jgi:hypothetical protein
MPTRRLDDRIRRLCARVPAAPNEELESILQDLLGAVHEKIERLRDLTTDQLLRLKPLKERRATHR